jgi:hypothetical protein
MSRMVWIRLLVLVLFYSFLIWNLQFFSSKVMAFVLFLASAGYIIHDERKGKNANRPKDLGSLLREPEERNQD